MKRNAWITVFAIPMWAQPVFSQGKASIGKEVAMPVHFTGGQEFEAALPDLIAHGRALFSANWTRAEGGGRPLTKGTGKDLTDPGSPLTGARSMNRISGPDSNSCAGCHNAPFGIAGGSGDFVTGVFVLGQRFDFATLDRSDRMPTRGAVDESGRDATLQTIANYRATTGLHGSGYIELLARQITADLRAIRNAIPPGGEARLRSTGVDYGSLSRDADGQWITSGVEGLSMASLATTGPSDPPNLVIRPWHQAGAVVSLREFANNAFNHHHGIQTVERFGADLDPDGDGFTNEMTVGDVTAAVLFQATMAPPGRVIPDDPDVENAVLAGEKAFGAIGCASCHLPKLMLRGGAMFREPGPYNPAGNASPASVGKVLEVNLGDARLPGPRLAAGLGANVEVPAFTDLKLHDLMDAGAADDNAEPLNMQQPAGSVAFAAGNTRFLTYRLWDSANQPPYGHHGRFSTLREAVEAHGGEAAAARAAWRALDAAGRDAIIEFLKTLQVLPPGVKNRIVNQRYERRDWPPVRN